MNHSNAQVLEEEAGLHTSQDKELLAVLESIENINNSLNSWIWVSVTGERKVSGYFYSETV